MLLFGSWSRGEAKEDSDVDVVVVLKSLSGMEVRGAIYEIVSQCVKRPVTLIDIREETLTKEDLELSPLLLNVAADGVIVWDPEGILERFLREGRRVIEELKLVRYRTPDGKYGWKRADGIPLAEAT